MKKLSPSLRLCLFFFVLFALLTKIWVSSWSDASAMATIQSLVDHQTFAIDQSLFFDQAGDKYLYNNQHYFHKAPILSLYGAVFYSLLKLTGLSFENQGRILYPMITVLTIGGLTCVGLFFMYRIFKNLFGVSKEWAELITFLAGAGTLLLPYSLAFNNDSPSGILMLIGFYCFLKYKSYNIGYLIAAGVLFSLAGSININCFLFIPVLGVLKLSQSFRAGVIFFLSCLPIIAVYFGLNLLNSGSFLPPAINPSLWQFSGSAFNPEVLSGHTGHTGLARHDSLWSLKNYSFHTLIGNRGLFSHTPILIASVIGLFALFNSKSKPPYRKEIFYLMLASALYMIVCITRSTNYSGDSFGFRWFVTLMPILMLPLFQLEDIFNRRKWFRYLFLLLAITSCLFSLIGSYSPYAPGFYLSEGESYVANTVLANLRLILFESPLAGKLRLIFAAFLVYFYLYKLLQRSLRYQSISVEASYGEIK